MEVKGRLKKGKEEGGGWKKEEASCSSSSLFDTNKTLLRNLLRAKVGRRLSLTKNNCFNLSIVLVETFFLNRRGEYYYEFSVLKRKELL